MNRSHTFIDIKVSRKFSRCISTRWLRATIQKVLESIEIDIPVELGVVITGDQTVQRLNKIYRGKNEPTDVLAFPMSVQQDTTDMSFISPPDGICHLGEIVISYPQAKRQCEEHGHMVEKELQLLIVHGILHLFGYDHEEVDERKRMHEKEKEILARLTTF